MKKSKKSGIKLSFCILNNGAEPGTRPTFEVDIEDIDVTPQQALEIAKEVENCKTITSWIHGPSDVMERELGKSE